MGFVFILGGARSGKSDLAFRLGEQAGRGVTFVATATPDDEEMAQRISLHRATRPVSWSTIEAPLEVVAAINAAGPADFVIVDCLTLWVSNLLGAGNTPQQIGGLAEEAASAMSRRDGVVVSNEVGLGIVPANEMARAFRDVLGAVNVTFAQCSERSLLMVAGRALELTTS